MKNQLDEARDTLERLVRIYDRNHAMDVAMTGFGYCDTPFFETAGDIEDAIYAMVGENADELVRSVTHRALNVLVGDDIRIETLLVEYCRNHGMTAETVRQPAPKLTERGIFLKTVEEVGGYAAPEQTGRKKK